MSWFTPVELERAEAYHGPLATAELVATLAELALLTVAAWSSGPIGGGPAAAAQVGLVAAAAGFVPRLVAGLWRELRHEPVHGLVPRPGERVDGRTGDQPVVPVVVAVVVLGEMVRFLGRTVLWAGCVGLLAWWSARAPLVALVAIPAALAGAAALSVPVHRLWRFRVDRPVELPSEAIPLSLRAAAGALLRPVPVRWYRGGPATSLRGEDGYVVRSRSGAAVVLSPEVLDGPTALLEAVAAHELGHVHALRHGWIGAAMRAVAAALVAVGAGLALGRHPAGAVPGLWFVVGVGVAGELMGAMVLGCRRRAEAAADRWSAALLDDRAACIRAVRLRLVEAGVDLAPQGLRRWRSAYPPASARLDALAGGRGSDQVRAHRW